MRSPKVKENSNEKLHWFERFATKAIKVTGSSGAFITACLLIIVWIISGPVFHYSDVWQLAINTGTTIITFLMVFLIQKTQNKDALAIQIKLNELVAANNNASNRIVKVEDLSEEELERLNEHYTKLVELTRSKNLINTPLSIEDASRLEADNLNQNEDKTRSSNLTK